MTEKIRGIKKKRTDLVTISITNSKAKAIWNHQKKYRNMSKWVTQQILYHFGNQLNREQLQQCLKEEWSIMQREKDENVQQVYDYYAAKESKHIALMKQAEEETSVNKIMGLVE